MSSYQPFLVAPFNSGISTYLKPWMQPDEAFTEMEDAYVYRGVVQKRYGYSLYDHFPNAVGIYHLGTGNGTTTIFNGTLPYTTLAPIGKRSLEIRHVNGGTVVTNGVDDGTGTISGTNISAGTINYITGAISITFTVAPTTNTGIKVNFGIRIAVGNGVTTVFTPNLNTFVAGLPIHARSLFIKNTFSAQNSAPGFDTPNGAGTTGTFDNPGQVINTSVTYATGATSFQFAVAPPVAAANQDIWARWEFTAPTSPIKGIETYWDANGDQQTLVFNNTQVAQFDSANFKLTNISGGDIFATTTKAFFSTANYQSKLFILNNTDPLTIWDGVSFIRPTIQLTDPGGSNETLITGLHIFLYKNRLNILRPTTSVSVKPQRDLYSALNNPFNWRTDIQAAGGFIDAPSPEWIIAAEFVRDDLCPSLQESSWRLRYTAIDTAPYRWEKIQDSRRIDSPYSAVKFEKFTNVVGQTGLLKNDNANVDRYDEKIIDFTTDEMDQENLDIINGYRFDNLNQQLLCFRSSDEQNLTFCDKWLIWGFIENNFAVFNIPSTTFGDYIRYGQDLAWQDFTAANNLDFSWSDFQDQTWLSYFSGKGAKVPVFGTEDGIVYQLLPLFTSDNGTKTGFSFLTKDFNPFIKQGQRCNFGFVDFYFDRPNDFPAFDPLYLITIDFYTDENPNAILSVILNPSENDWEKKRVYVNANGQFHRFKIYLSDDQIANSTATRGFVLNGFILWMGLGGRISG